MDDSIRLSVAIPAYNEEATIAELVGRVLEAITADDEIIIVDDGSTDSTVERVRKFSELPNIQLIVHEKNSGKGAAIRTAIGKAKGRLLIVQDADLEYDPNDYLRLMGPIFSDEADVVFGSRRLGRRTPLIRLLTPFYHGVTVLNVLVWLLYGHSISDEATCYKLFKLSDLKRMDLECERFEFCPEVIAKACRMRLRIKELPINYTPRSLKEGKKIGFADAVEATQTLWKYRKWTCSNMVSALGKCSE